MATTLRRWWTRQRQERFAQAIGLGTALGLIIATFVLPGGQDAHGIYRRAAEGCGECTYMPYQSEWLLFPLRFIPIRFLWPVMTAISLAGIWWSARRLGTLPAIVIASWPMLAYVWLGQFDVLIIVGFTLMLTSKNPYIRGIGMLMTSIKPQVSGPAILLLWVLDDQRWKTLIIPAGAFAISLAVFGPDWPLRWWNYIMAHPHDNVWARGALFPWGLVAFPLILLFREKRDRLTVALLATTLGIPRVGIYSHVAYLVLFAPWWSVPLSYVWSLAIPWLGNEALRFTFLLPLGVLAAMVWPHIKAWRNPDNAPERSKE